jgi:cell shape-determining protein MreD
MTEGTRWHFVAFITLLVALHFFLRVGLGLGWAVPDLLVVAVLLSARRIRGGWAAGLGVLLGVMDGAVLEYTMGASALALAILGYLGSRSRDVLSGDTPISLVLYLLAGKWAFDVLLFLLLALTSTAPPASALILVSPLAALYAAGAGLMAVAAYRAVN